MINVAILSSIRRWHLRDQVSIREIARRTGLSRITIKKYLFSGIVEPAYPERISPGKLDGYRELLANWLQVESPKSIEEYRETKCQLSLFIYNELVLNKWAQEPLN